MYKLMVVDDEVEICDFVKSFFEERNFDVCCAYNGSEALGLAQSSSPDVILLDMLMPVMDGMQTLKELTRRKIRSRVIMVTAIDDTAKIKEARSNGARDYITKPLLLENLERAVLLAAQMLDETKKK
ncbi:MAG: response regulator [Candidatus Omnitrophica bacterium]|nr:response regulator [Candidatus Omnitrophota bacterium]